MKAWYADSPIGTWQEEEDRKNRELLREAQEKEREQMQQSINMDDHRIASKDLKGGAYVGGASVLGAGGLANLRGGDESDSDDADD